MLNGDLCVVSALCDSLLIGVKPLLLLLLLFLIYDEINNI